MRDRQIDFLRFLGISLIILAHVHPPWWVFQLRNFDVPLIVLVSGMALQQTNLRESYIGYVWKRIKRLVFPLWFFLSGYFLFVWLTGIKFDKLTFSKISGSYLLMEGIGFVWIIRVFLLVALAAPGIFTFSKSIKSNKIFLLYLVLAYLAYEIFLYLTYSSVNNIEDGVISSFVYFGIAYSLVFALGVRLNQLTQKESFLVAAVTFIGLITLGFIYYFSQGHFVATQKYKYPPRAYYLCYAISASILAWWITKKFNKYWGKLGWAEEVAMFIAQNSLWVYLWHIFFLKSMSLIPMGKFYFKYFLVYTGAVLTTYFQVWFVQKELLMQIKNEKIKSFLRVTLTG